MLRKTDYWESAKAHLSAADPVMAGIIQRYQGEEGLISRGNAFETLVRSIVGQQISVKAADSVWDKVNSAFVVEPQVLIAAPEGALRACGLSGRKVTYIQGLATAFAEERLHPHHWHTWSDDAVKKELVALPGIGPWTAEMFLMFHLLRPNVLPLLDIGLLKGYEVHYNQPRSLLPAHAQACWQPFCSVATWYLWRSLDPVPVAY